MNKTVKIGNSNRTINKAVLAAAGLDPHVRIMSVDDFASIISIEEKAFDPKLYDSLLTRKSLKRILEKANAIMLIYQDNETVAGYAQIFFSNRLVCGRFYSLAVDSKYEGKGIASVLFKSVELICKHLGAPTVLLEIREDNRALNYRYTKLGYAPYKRVEKYYTDGCAAIKMRKTFS